MQSKARGTLAVIPHERRILHVLPREFMVDGQEGVREPLGLSGNRLEVNVHVITGAVTSAQNIIKSVNRAGLDVVDIILQPLASSEAVLSQEERDLGVAMVDLGGGTTDLAIFLDGSIRHSAVLPIGGQNLTKDLAIGLLTSQTEAEKIKVQHGMPRTGLVQGHETVEVPSVGDRPARTFSRRDIAEILEPRVEEIFELVRREITRAGYEGMLGAGVVDYRRHIVVGRDAGCGGAGLESSGPSRRAERNRRASRHREQSHACDRCRIAAPCAAPCGGNGHGWSAQRTADRQKCWIE